MVAVLVGIIFVEWFRFKIVAFSVTSQQFRGKVWNLKFVVFVSQFNFILLSLIVRLFL